MGRIGITELLVVLAIVIVLFGTKRLRNLGGDLGAGLQSFRKAVSESNATPTSSGDGDPDKDQPSEDVIEDEGSTGKGKGDH
jgi:sec-independent protein translocase protein TatA